VATKRLKFDSLSYKTLFIVVFLLLIGIIGLLRLRQQPSSVTASWFDESFSYRKAITVTNSSGSDLTDFQVAFDIGTSALIAQDKMQTDCDDIRITDQNGKLLPHWIEEGNLGCNSPDGDTKVWVKAPSLPTSGATLFVYYGNTIATNVSSIENTFGAIQKISLNSPYTTSPSPHGSYSDTNGTQLTNGVVREELFSNIEATVGWLNQTPSITITLDTSTYLSYFKFHAGGGGTGGINMPTSVNIEYSTDNVVYHQIGVGSSWSNTEQWVTINSKPLNAGKYVKFTFSPNSWIMLGELEIYGYPEANITPNPPTLSLSATEESSPAPIAYWKFDEGVGTTAYDSIGKHHGSFGTGNSSPSWQSDENCISGKCLYFDGNEDYIDTNFDYSMTYTGGSTFSLWFRPSTTNTSGQIKNLISKNSFEYSISQLDDDLKIQQWNPSGSNAISITVENILEANRWYFLSLVYDGSLEKSYLYLNGKTIAEENNSQTSFVDRTETTKIGSGYGWGGSPNPKFNGFIDEVKIYPYARTPDQINADYNAGLSGVSSSKGSSAILGSSSNKPLSDGLVAHWKMDEASWNGTSGEVLDASGNNNHGTGVNNVTTGTGKFGNGGNFVSASNHYVDISDSLFDLPQRTVSLWMYNNAASGDRLAFSSGTGSPVRWYQGVSGGSNLYFRVGNGDLITLPFENLNRWVHYVITYDGTTAKAYANGQQLHSYDVTLSGATQVGIGAYNKGSGFFFSGSIDEVRIYNRALSPDEVKQLYIWAPEPIAYFNFENTIDNTTYDVSGVGNTGIITGASISSGKYGKGLKFTQPAHTINFGNSDIYKPNSKIMTLGQWFKFDNSDADQQLFFISTEYTLFKYAGSNNLVFKPRLNNSWGYGNIATSINVNDGQWHYIALVMDYSNSTKTYKLYIDGQLAGTSSSSESYTQTSDPLKIGYWGTDPRHLIGSIDEVKIYNYARTPSQIIEDMNAGHPIGGSPVGSQVAYWRMDEGVGSTVNNSGNGGTVLNGSLTGSVPPSWSNNGKFGKALDFSSGYVQTDPTTISNTSTYTAWFKVDSFNNWGAVITNLYHSAPASGFNIIPYPDAIRVCYGDGVNGYAYRTFSVPNLTTGTWYHVAVSYDGSKFSLYFDGKHIDDHAATMVQINQFFRLGLWASSYTQYFFDGLIDEVKIYNTALTPDQIKIDMNQGKSMVLGSNSTNTGTTAPPTSASAEYCIPGDPSSCSPPVAEWKFDEGIGTTAFDTSANNNHANFGAGGSSPIWVKGKESAGLKFDGNDYALTGNAVSSSAYTFSSWFKTTQNAPNTDEASRILTIHRTGTLAGSKIAIGMRNGGKAYFLWHTGSAFVNLQSDEDYNDNKWHYLSAATDGTNFKLYIDGVLKKTTTSTLIATTTDQIIGAQNTGSSFWNGDLDDIRIYDYARSTAQIALDYNRGAPIGHWRLDECQGTTINDSSGFGNHGTLTIGAGGTQTSPGTCQTSDTAWHNGINGKFNSSINFDGVDDYVSIINPSSDNFGTGPMSVSAWIKTTTTSSFSTIIDNKTAGTNNAGFNLQLDGNKQPYFRVANGTTQFPVVATGKTLNDNQWHNIIGVFERTGGVNDKIHIYVNGKLINTYSSVPSGWNITSNQNLLVGQYGGNGYFNGQIDDVRIYNYALTSEQVKTLYNNGAVSFQ
jgi:hypothetical protein